FDSCVFSGNDPVIIQQSSYDTANGNFTITYRDIRFFACQFDRSSLQFTTMLRGGVSNLTRAEYSSIAISHCVFRQAGITTNIEARTPTWYWDNMTITASDFIGGSISLNDIPALAVKLEHLSFCNTHRPLYCSTSQYVNQVYAYSVVNPFI